MTDWKPSAGYQKIADANREYYALTAAQYESSETCVMDTVIQAALESDLDQIVAQLGGRAAKIRALDACGGSGASADRRTLLPLLQMATLCRDAASGTGFWERWGKPLERCLYAMSVARSKAP